MVEARHEDNKAVEEDSQGLLGGVRKGMILPILLPAKEGSVDPPGTVAHDHDDREVVGGVGEDAYLLLECLDGALCVEDANEVSETVISSPGKEEVRALLSSCLPSTLVMAIRR